MQTYQAIRRKDEGIIDLLKKRRGRKKFILIDKSAKERLSKKNAKELLKLNQPDMYGFGDYEAEKQVNPFLTTRHRNETKVLNEIND